MNKEWLIKLTAFVVVLALFTFFGYWCMYTMLDEKIEDSECKLVFTNQERILINKRFDKIENVLKDFEQHKMTVFHDRSRYEEE